MGMKELRNQFWDQSRLLAIFHGSARIKFSAIDFHSTIFLKKHECYFKADLLSYSLLFMLRLRFSSHYVSITAI